MTHFLSVFEPQQITHAKDAEPLTWKIRWVYTAHTTIQGGIGL